MIRIPYTLCLFVACGLSATSSGQERAPEARAAAPDAGARESRWPLELDAGDDHIVIYQPQLETFTGDKLTSRAAVSIQHQGQPEPTFGALWLESRAATDRVTRTVQILDVKVPRARFPDDAGREEELTAVLRKRLAENSLTLSLDQLLEMLAAVEKEKRADERLLTTPPRLEFRAHPAVLIQYDGQPRFSPAGEGGLLRAVNTPFLVVLDPTSKKYYLKGAGQWFRADEALGPFQGAKDVPDAVRALAEKSGYQDPEEKAGAPEDGLEVITATEPTELIWADGPPQFAPIPGTSLLYVTNTDADVFLDIDSQYIYILLSGRWFTAQTRNGPWTYVAPDKLPPDFQRIPPGSEKGDVLAQVAGTEAAQDALLDNYVPQTATVDRKKAQPPKVEYDGAPQFEPVEGGQVTYAVNTSSAVLEVNNEYYCCDNAVWYSSSAPTGPWEVCLAVPPAIYTLPPSCPVYPVKYVYVYDHDDSYVYCGYTPGYVGCYAFNGAVVFGTGYVYPAWTGSVYYPRPATFGFSAHYNAYTGNWGFTVGAAGPNGWLAVHGGSYGWFAAGGRTGGWAAAGGVWGYGGYRQANIGNVNSINVNRNELNVNRNTFNQANRISENVYNRRDDVRRDADRQRRAEAGAAGRRDLDRPAGDRRTGGRPANDVFADKQGNVHRKTLDGWEQREKGQWVPQKSTKPRTPEAGAQRRGEGAAQRRPDAAPQHRPEATPPHRSDLDRDARARAAGAHRSQTYQRPSGFRPSGGGMRGFGGGRRR
jgi:hypothetical protein